MVQGFLAGACVDAEVFALRPDYRVLLGPWAPRQS